MRPPVPLLILVFGLLLVLPSQAAAYTLQPTTALPEITDPIIIDGSTQPDFAGTPVIELDGSAILAVAVGLKISAGNSLVRSLVINNFWADAIELDTNGGNTIEGCYLGTNMAGTAAAANFDDGIQIETDGNTIGGTTAAARNIISGNGDAGIDILQGASGNFIYGNYIGTNAAGTGAVPNSASGVILTDTASSNEIGGTAAGAGNVISGNGGNGVMIQQTGTASNLIQGNFIGTDFDGTDPLANGSNGVNINSSATSNTVGGTAANAGNVISGNTGRGIALDGPSTTGNSILGNLIGTNAAGSAPIPNNGGIEFSGNTNGNTIGGTTAAARNVISGNNSSGIVLTDSGTTGNQVEGNYIGLDASGANDLGNDQDGVTIQLGANTNNIGGTAAGARNIISGNGGEGVAISGAGTDDNIIEGNFIGTTAAGTSDVPNDSDGIRITNSADGTQVGGTTAEARNVISGNGARGMLIGSATGTIVEGNYIGVDSGGSTPLGNSYRGIEIGGTSSGNTIGGIAAGAGNIVAHNTNTGIVILDTAVGNSLLGNAVHDNTAGDIDLGNDGVTVNDSGDGDTGPNQLQNYPVLTAAGTSGASPIRIEGTFNSAASTTFRIEFFANTNVGSGGTSGAWNFIGTTDVTTNGSGDTSFDVAVPEVVPVGGYVCAIATDPTGNSSEYSAIFTTTAIEEHIVIVDTVNDTDDGNTTNIATLNADPGTDGWISLREAIIAANGTNNSGGPDEIYFDIAGVGPHTIQPSSALPDIDDPVIIDGTTEPDFTTTPIVVLDGISAGGVNGLTISGGGSTVRGLVIHSFDLSGIRLETLGGNTIVGNFIGPDVTGLVGEVGNKTEGISIYQSPSNVIGGTTPANRNVITGNRQRGITLDDLSDGAPETSTGNRIIGNYIGTDLTGTTYLPHDNTGLNFQQMGIYSLNAVDTEIGGTAAGEGNLISGNHWHGIYVWGPDGHGNLIKGNNIGLDAAGLTPIGNGWENATRSAVLISNAPDNTIGGTEAGATNEIAGNPNYGVQVSGVTGVQNQILRNSIHDNGDLGIDLGIDGVTANDANDSDTGPNNLQNFPTLLSAETDGSTTLTVSGGITAAPFTAYRIEFFSNATTDGSGYGEGETYLGFVDRTTTGAGTQTFNVPLSVTVPPGHWISATATSPSGDTSEFSQAIEAFGQSDLQLAKVVDNGTPNEGATVTYTVTLTNAGPHDATGITVSDLLPAGVTYVSNTPSQGSYVSATGVWTVGGLANGLNATLQLVATVDGGTAGTTVTNNVSITAADQTDLVAGNNTASAGITVSSADLQLAKVVDNGTPNEGDTVTYTVTLTNAGPNDATGITVTDLLPAGVTYVSDTPSQGIYNNGSGLWSAGSVANAASVTLQLVATVDGGTSGTTITNNAAITAADQADPVAGNNTASAGITVSSADLQLAKVVDNGTPNEGDTVTYTVTLANAGPNDATVITVADALPAGVTYVSDTPSQGTYVSGTGVWTVGSVANAASVTLQLVATVDGGTAGTTVTNNAAITAADQTDPVAGNNTASADIDVASSDLQLAKVVDNGTPNEGDTVTYTVTLTNAGPNNATGITVTDLLPAGMTYVSDTPSQGIYNDGSGLWSAGSVANGANVTLQLVATVDGGTAGTTVTNNAAITAADQADPAAGNNTASADIDVNSSDLQLAKVVDNGTPNEGDTVTYTVTLTNAGPNDATGITVTDLLPAGVTYVSDTPSQGTYVSGTGVWTVGSVANGASPTLQLVATVDGGTAGTTVTNNAAITAADQADPVGGNNTASAGITVSSADLQLAKVVNNGTPNEGDTVTYTVTLTNAGPNNATGITVTDALPAGVTYVSDTPSQGTYVSGTGVWTVGSVANAASVTLQLVATVDGGTAGTTVTNNVAITAADQADPVGGNNTASAGVTVSSADLQLAKVVDNGSPNEGDTVTYTVTLINAGPNDATGITVTDALPAGVTYVSDTPSQGTYVSGTGVWTVGSVANAASVTLQLVATVDGGTSGTTITNNAAITAADQADPVAGNNTASAGISVSSADMQLAKVVDNGTPNEGDTVTYTVTLTNAGPNNATGITVTDALPAGVTYVSDTPSQGTYVSGTGVWTVGNVANAASVTLQLVATVDGGTAGTTVTNNAAITAADQADPVGGNNTASAGITISSSDLQLAKVVDNGTPNEGDTVTYTVTLTNAGPNDATGITVTDLLPAGVTYVSDTPSQGTYVSGTGVWTVGSVANAASVTLQLVVTVDGGTAGTTVTNNASITAADQADPVGGNNTASAGITVSSSDLQLAKVVDNGTPNEGDTVTYTVTLTNAGPNDATGITVADALPAGVTYVSDTPSQGTYVSGTGVWTVGSVANAASVTLQLVATVDGGTAGTTVTNNADITAADQADPVGGNNTASAGITVSSADLQLAKVVDNGSPNEGDTVTYTVTLTNAGPNDATGITVTDALPAGVTYVSDTPSQGTYVSGTGVWTVGSVANAASVTLQLVATVDGGTAGTTVTNNAAITAADQADPTGANNTASAGITVSSADLQLAKVVDNGSPNEGDTVTYTVTLTNAGPNDATGITVTDLLPAGVTFVSDTPSQGTYVSGTGIWTIGSVANAASVTLQLVATVDIGTGGTTITNTATVTAADQADPNAANNTASAGIASNSADLQLAKVVDNGTPNEGDTVTYTVTLTNAGPNDATGVTVTDLLPAGVTYVSDTPSQGTYVSGTGVWTVGSVANAASVTLQLVATVDGGTAGTTVTNNVSITAADQADPVGGNNTASAGITVSSADLQLAKVVDNGTPNEGDTVTYTVTLTNAGPNDATGITVTDLLPAGVTYVSDTPSQGTYVSGTGVWTVGSVANAANATLQLVATVDGGTAGTTVTNNASITAADQADPVGGNNAASAGITVSSADLQLAKVVDNGSPNEGDTVTYTVTLTNAGPNDATGITVTDALPAGVTYVSDTPSQGTYVSGTGVWTVGSVANAANATLQLVATVDIGTGGTTITNTATVTAADQADPNAANNTASAGIASNSADLQLAKVVDNGTPNEGDTVTYTVTLTNAGPNDATGITVTDALPAGVTYVSDTPSQGTYVSGTGVWTVGNVANTASVTLQLVATVDGGTAGTTVTNNASITAADQADPVGGNNTASAGITVSSADLQLAKVVDNGTPNEGDTVTYTVTLTNAGPNDATGITVTDALPAGVTYVSDTPSQGTYVSGTGVWTVGSVANGGSATLQLVATVNGGTAGTTVSNNAAITAADQADPVGANNNASAGMNVRSANLSVSMVVDDSTPNEGGNVTFTVTLSNFGPDNATNVEVTDLLPAGLTYVSDTPSQGGYLPVTGVWSVGSIANSGSAILTLVCSVDAGTSGTTITNIATVTAADQGDPFAPNNTASAAVNVSSSNLVLSKIVDEGAPNEGDTVTYTVTVSNSGPDDATGIEVTDLLPAGVTYVSDTPSQGSYLPVTGVWTVGSVGNAGNAVLTLVATVDAGTAGTTVTNNAAITATDQGDPDGGDNNASAGITVNNADLQITKIVDNNAPNEGDTVTYTVTLTNAGPNDATGITVTDLLPTGVTYVSDTPSQGSYLPGTGVWTVGNLLNSGNATLSLVATVDAGTAGTLVTNTAAVSGADQADSDAANNTASAGITVINSDLQLAKVVDNNAPNEGDTVTYTVTLTNAGPDDATGISVTDLLPTGVTYVSDTPSQGTYVSGTGVWTIGSVANAASVNLQVVATVDGGTAGSTITNVANITAADQADSDGGNNTASAGVAVNSADIQLAKVVDNNAPNEGDTVTYTVTLTNAGPNDATGISLTDLLPAGVTYVSDTPSQGTYVSGTGVWTVGSVANAANVTLQIVATVDGGTAGTTVTNNVAITAADQADPDPVNNTASADITVSSADLQLAKVVDNNAPNEGDTVTYTVTVTNAGPNDATGITVTDLLPTGVTYVSDTPSQGTYVAGTGVWTIGDVVNTANVTLQLVATVDGGTSGTSITNNAAVTAADQADPVGGNNAASADITVSSADLQLAKVVDINAPNEGDTVTYTVTLTNAGPNDATGITVTDLLPTGVTYVSDTPSQGTYVSGTGVWTIGDVANAANVTLQLVATVDGGTAGTTVTNNAAITAADQADPVGGNNTASAGITVSSADLQLAKVVDNNAPNEGDTVTYTVTVTNAGPNDATGISVTDLLPAGVTYVSDTPSQGTYVAGTGVWTVGGIVNGNNATLTLVATADAGTAGTTITNNAAVTAADQADPDPVNNTASSGITVSSADLQLAKVVDNNAPNEGETVTYTVTLTNAGPNDATGISVTDLLPAGVTYVSDTPSQGAYVSGTGVWTVGSVANAANVTLQIVATVDGGTAGTTVTNNVAITAADQADPDPVNNTASADITVSSSDLQLAKVVDNNAPNEGETVTYTVTLTNAGPNDATGISVTDLLPAGVTYVSDTPSQGTYVSGTGVWTVGGVANASNVTLQLVATVDGGTSGTSITNTAAITAADQADADPVNNTASAGITVRSADLQLAKVVDNSAPNEGDTVNYTVTLTNAGPNDATGITVTDLLPTGVTFQSAQIYPVISLVQKTSSVAQNSSSVSATFSYAPTEGNLLVAIAGNRSDSDPPSNPGGWTLVGGASGNTPGQLMYYKIAGPAESATVTLSNYSENSNRGLHLYEYSGVDSANPLDDSGSGTGSGSTLSSGTVSASNDGALVIVGFTTNANTSFTGWTNGFSEQNDFTNDGVTSSRSTYAGAHLIVGSAGNYSTSATTGSSGSWRAQTAVFNPAPAPGGWNYDEVAGLWDIGSVANGMDATLNIVATVDAGTGGTTITNNAAITAADQTDPDPVNNTASAGITVSSADLQLAKVVDNNAPNEGDTVTYTVTLTNAGPNDATGVTTTDLLPTGVTYVSNIPSQGNYVSSSGLWTVGSIANGNSATLTLVATVNNGTAGTIVTNNAAITAADQADPAPGNNTAQADIDVQANLSVTVELRTIPLELQSALPGGPAVEALRLELVNQGAQTETLETLAITNFTTGPGTMAELDGDWQNLALMVESNGLLSPPNTIGTTAVTTGVFNDSRLIYNGLAISLAPGDTVRVVVQAQASLTARDGDVLAIEVVDSADVLYAGSGQSQAEWPLSSGGGLAVDGMVADQLTLQTIDPSQILLESVRNLALEVVLPANGYQGDHLERLNIINTGSAEDLTDVSRIEGWADDGDGIFNPNSDSNMGEFAFTGSRWELTGLNLAIPLSNQRVFITVDIAGSAREGRTVQLGLPNLPDVGVGMVSDNDGPIDRPVINPFALAVSTSNRVILSTGTILPGIVAPGQSEVPLLHLVALNAYSSYKRLTELSVRNGTFGLAPDGSPELDGELDQLKLRIDGNSDGVLGDLASDPVIATGSFSGGEATFSGLAWNLEAGASNHLFVTGDISLTGATDGDVVSAFVSGGVDLSFEGNVSVSAVWPLDSGARWTVDGLVAAQVGNNSVPSATLAAGEGPALVLDLQIPANGYADDTLTGLKLVNLGTATSSDMANLSLWSDGGDGIFSGGGGDDVALGPFVWMNDNWLSPVLNTTLSAGGTRLFVGLTVAAAPTNASTVQLAVPVGGITVASSNDGPLDEPVQSQSSILLSTAPLLAEIRFDQQSSTVGQTVTARMLLRNVGGENMLGLTPQALVFGGDGSMTLAGGPTPASFDLAPGAVDSFSWSFTAASHGNVTLSGSAEGMGEDSGQARSSLPTSSGQHEIYDPASNLEMFAVANMPFTINRGQTDVVPLTLTFINPGGESRADALIQRLRIRLRNEAGTGIIPTDLLSRVVVNEGGITYLDKTNLETSGDQIDLILDYPVLVTNQEPVTLGLRLDIQANTSVPAFMVEILNNTWIEATDAISDAPISVTLQEGAFPVQSGLGTLLVEATGLQVAAVDSGRRQVGFGQQGVTLLTLEMLNPGTAGLGSEVRVGSLAVSLTDTLGTPMAVPSQVLSKLRVTSPLQSLLDITVVDRDSTVILLNLTSPLTVPVDTPLELTIEADIADPALAGAVQVRLADAADFLAVDSNSGSNVPVTYGTDPVIGSTIVVQQVATEMMAQGTPQLPNNLVIGARQVPALEVALRHPGGPNFAAIQVESLLVQSRDQDRELVAPVGIVDALEVILDGQTIGTINNPDGDGNMTIPLSGVVLQPGQTIMLTLLLSLEVSAPTISLELLIPGANIYSVDVNLDQQVMVLPEPGEEFPLTSGLTRLQESADELRVDFTSLMPAVLVASPNEIPAARFALRNPTQGDVSGINLISLSFRASDDLYQAFPIGEAVQEIRLYNGDDLWATSGIMATTDTLAVVQPPAIAYIAPAAILDLEMAVVYRPSSSVKIIRLGCDEGDVHVLQPDGALALVRVEPEDGQLFPFWTETGSFSGASLEDSYSNFPNPFAAGREVTTFAFSLDQPATVSLKLMTGHATPVVTIIDGEYRPAGLYQQDQWEGRNERGTVLQNGVYVAELTVVYQDGTKARLRRKVAVVR